MRCRTFLGVMCLALLLAASHARAQFSQLYIFGDSLSDTGNLATVLGDFPFPYFMNRVSNGPVAVETLASLLALEANASLHLIGPAQGTNYAVGGARARGSEAGDLTAQIGFFMQNHGNAAPPDALYTVMIGGNDARDARDADEMAAQEIIAQATSAIATGIEALASAGAMRFLVVNVPDLGAIPETRIRAEANGTPSLIELATMRSEAFNQALADEVARLRTEFGLKIALVDLFSGGRAVTDNAAAYDLENLTDPCFLLSSGFQPGCDNGANFDVYAYFDDVHPTAKVHALFGRILFSLSPLPPDAAP